MRRFSVLLCACVILSCFTNYSFAYDLFGKPPAGTVSIIDYGVHGMKLGLFGGVCAGYVRYENENDKGGAIALSGAYGVLLGAGLGIVLGGVDASNGSMGIGALIIRDMDMGGNLGALLGTILGGIKALNNNDSRWVGDGTAWGYLGGAVLGAGLAFIEEPRSSSSAKADTNNGVVPSVVFLQDSRRNTYPALAATYNF